VAKDDPGQLDAELLAQRRFGVVPALVLMKAMVASPGVDGAPLLRRQSLPPRAAALAFAVAQDLGDRS
jgi:hypothetical protein